MSFALSHKLLVPLMRNVRYSSHGSTEQLLKTRKLMKVMSLTFIPATLALVGINTYLSEKEHLSHPRPEYVPYSHIGIRSKRFPWGDGNHSLFHHPKANYVPGVGYEEEWY